MGKPKLIFIVLLITALWLGVLLKLGLRQMTMTPAEGHLSRTFEGWEKYPASRHVFLGQLDSNDFEQGRVYVSGSYPFLFTNFLLLAPFHYGLGLPYTIAHNFLPYIFVLCVTFLLILATRKELGAINQDNRLLLWLLAFLCIGITITDPLPWTSSFNAGRDNAHIITAGLFCYLSTWVFYDKVPKTPLLVVGILLALWSPTAIPAWILAGIFLHRTLKLDRKWIFQVAVVVTLAAINVLIPRLTTRWAGVQSTGSGLLTRSGLDGSLMHVSSIPQAVISPGDPRHWPTGLYFILTAILALGLHYTWKDRERHRPLQQAAFLLIPYLTFAIFLPQLTSVHPYITDLFIFIPATFLMSFWFLQRSFWKKLSGRLYVGWFLFACFILMSNLLAFAQMPRFAYLEGKRNLVGIILSVMAILIYAGVVLWRRLHKPTQTV
jgi:hypothetical protein